MREAGEVEYVGVRHHSPTGARLVAERIRANPPAAVLIEGPSAFNDRLDELDAPHQLPIMIYTWAPLHPDAEPGTQAWAARRAAYYPMCDYSPEWTAFQAARSAGVPAEFIDLPWLAFAEHARSENRFAQPAATQQDRPDALRALFAALGVDQLDTLFDEVLEVDPGIDLATYQERAELVGTLLRDPTPDEETSARESFMAERIREAQERVDGTVLVVCGAAHVAGLRAELAQPPQPHLPPWAPPPGDERYGLALTPTSYAFLDALDGYNAGQPTPGFYDALWQDRLAGHHNTAERVLTDVLGELRRAGAFVSTADVIATLTSARGLAAVRGHAQIWRTDLIDGMVSALVKDDGGADHPLLARARLAMRGDRLGKLADGTALPPLVRTVQARIEELGLTPTPTERTVPADLTDAVGRERSHLLHGLLALEVPLGRLRQPAEADGTEQWSVRWTPGYEGNLVAASRYGATLGSAVTARLLEESLAHADDPAAVTRIVLTATECGLPELAATLRQRVDDLLATTGDLGGLGEAIEVLMRLYRYDPLLGATGRADLGALLTTAFGQAVRLTERLGRRSDDAATARLIDALTVVTDALERTRTTLALDAQAWDEALAALMADPEQAAGLRGAALGGRWLGGALPDADLARSLRTEPKLDRLGDFVAGLLSVAREAAIRRPEVILELDRLIAAADDEEFLTAVPGLRRAFSRYPPRERAHIAEVILGSAGEEILDAGPDTAAVAAFEARLTQTVRTFLGEGAVL